MSLLIGGGETLGPATICEYWGRIVGVRSTEQFAGIRVGDICPGIIYVVKEKAALSDDV